MADGGMEEVATAASPPPSGAQPPQGAQVWPGENVEQEPAAVQAPSPWPGETVSYGVEDKIGAIGVGTQSGLVKGALGTAGGIAGAGIGTLGGPAAPFTVPLGFIAGSAIGVFASPPIENILGIPSEAKTPTRLRPYRAAGETFGAVIPFTAMPYEAARRGLKTMGGYLDDLIGMAQKHPASLFTKEMSGASGAALFGGVTEGAFPGEPLPRMAAEMAGGFLSPLRVGGHLVHWSWDAAQNVMGRMTPEAQMTKAGQILRQWSNDLGGDPSALPDLMRASALPGLNLTSAQKTGDLGLAALEAALVKENAAFGQEAAKRAQDGLDTIKGMILVLAQTGDPAAFKAAGELRDTYFRALLTGKVDAAERAAVGEIARSEQNALLHAREITWNRPEQLSSISKKAYQGLAGAVKDTGDVAHVLWTRVPDDIPARSDGIAEKFSELRATMLPEDKMPALAEGFLSRMEEAGGRTTSGELILFRRRMLEAAREASEGTWQGHRNDARIFGDLAHAAMDDLDNMAVSPAFGAYGRTAGDAYDAARSFTREREEVFTRTFVGETTLSTRTGADKIPPELLLGRAFGSGGTEGALRLKEIEEAVGFVPRVIKEGRADVAQALGPERVRVASEKFDEMMSLQEKFIRLVASNSTDPVTGRVSPGRLAGFLRDNAEIMGKFPEAGKIMSGALDAEVAAGRMSDEAKAGAAAVKSLWNKASTVANERAAFAKVAGVEAPADAVRKALAGPQPLVDIHAMVRMARAAENRFPKQAAGALDGLTTSIWDNMIAVSTDANGVLDLGKLARSLDTPIRPRLPTPAQIMERNGLMSEAAIVQARELLDRAASIVTVGEVKALKEIPKGAVSAILDMAVRITGAQIGRAVAGATTGGTVQTPHIVAEQARGLVKKVSEKIPNAQLVDVLIKAARDPNFGAMLMELPATPAAKLTLARQMHAYLYAAGLLAVQDEQAGP